MKWAVFEFNDRSCEFGQTSWIQGEDAESFDNETWFFSKEIIVKWPKDFTKAARKMQRNIDVDINDIENERHPAKIVKLGGICLFYICVN